jgi:hypothetical protein
MTVAAGAVAGDPLAAQSSAVPASTSRPPKKRQIIAKADTVDQPEAR